MADEKPAIVDYEKRSRDLIADFFNFNDPPPRNYPEVKERKYPSYSVPVKPIQKMQRGQKGLDYVVAHKETVDSELSKVSLVRIDN